MGEFEDLLDAPLQPGRERTDYPREIEEARLAHASGNAVELAYRRTYFLDERRKSIEAWAGFCAA